MQHGNIYDTFVKEFFGRIVVFADFLLNYADPKFVEQIDLEKIQPAPTHYIGGEGKERIMDLIFLCPLKNGKGNSFAVVVFEHQSGSLKYVPLKLHKYISAFWDAEIKSGKKEISFPYFIVLRTGKKVHRKPYPQVANLLPTGPDGKPVGKTLEIEYDVVDMPVWDLEQLLGEPVLRVAMGALKTITEGTVHKLPKAILPLSELDDDEKKSNILKSVINLADKAWSDYNIRFDEKMLEEALKPIFRNPKRRKNMVISIFQEKFLEGKTEGKTEGIIEGKIETIFLILTDRLGGVSKRLEKKVQKINDVEKLNELIKLATRCENFKEFEKALN